MNLFVKNNIFKTKHITSHMMESIFEFELKHNHNKIFYEIFNKCLNNDIDKDDNYMYHSYLTTGDSKIKAFCKMNESQFVVKDKVENFNNLYFKTCKYYNAINNFGVMCKLKYKKKYEHNYDLCMNPLENYKESQIFTVIENDRVYRFWGKDLYKIINKRLTNNYSLFPEPKPVTNPYTNNKFSLSTLYNIYLFLLNSPWGVPKLYELYFQTNFNIVRLTECYMSELKDEIIKETIKFMSDKDLIIHTNKMLKANKSVVGGTRIISDDYPNDIVRKHMLSYVKLYLLSLVSTCGSKRLYYNRILRTKLKIFFKDNTHFGRNVYKRIPIYEKNSMFIKTGKYKVVKTIDNTEIISNMFYDKNEFSSNRKIRNNVLSIHNVENNNWLSKKRRIITKYDDYPNHGFTLKDDEIVESEPSDDDNDDDSIDIIIDRSGAY
jgi:hypothetical protein